MANLQNAKDIKHYNYGPVVTPYQLPVQQWDHPLGRYRVSAAKWRLASILSMSVAVLLLLVFILLLSMPKQQVFAVQTTKTGFVSGVYQLDQHYHIPETLYTQFVTHYVQAALSVTLSVPHDRRNQLYAEWFGDKTVLHTLWDQKPPFKLPPGVRQIVHIESMQLLNVSPTSRHYQVTWKQGRLQAGVGHPKQLRQKVAVFTIVRRQPEQARQIVVNPFGFYIAHMQDSTHAVASPKGAVVGSQ